MSYVYHLTKNRSIVPGEMPAVTLGGLIVLVGLLSCYSSYIDLFYTLLYI